MWREKKEQHKTSSVKHGAGSVMAWTYKAASGTDTLTFIDNFTADRSNRVNIEQYRCIVRFKTHFKTSAGKFLQDNDHIKRKTC